jgi:ribosome-binding protein aMBF1 (putative translation factor)
VLITGLACRMARAALGWSRDRLGAEALITAQTVRNFEQGAALHPNHIFAIQRAFEHAGIELVEVDGQVLVRQPAVELVDRGEDRAGGAEILKLRR